MDPVFLIFAASLVFLGLTAGLGAAAVFGAWLYRAGQQRSSPVPQMPRRGGGSGGGAPPDPDEKAGKPYHRKPPRP